MIIIATTKLYIAVDSIIANPTNKVRVIVDEASGCWASDSNAFSTDFPSLYAGNMHPIAVVNPAVIIETAAMRVTLSIFILLFFD